MKNTTISLFIIILIFLNSDFCKSQTSVDLVAPNISMNKDSLFEKFVPPVVPSYLFDYLDIGIYAQNDFYILMIVNVDENRKVSKLSKVPLYDLADCPDTSMVWRDILKSIDSVSKLWVFKPLLYKIDSCFSEAEKKYFGNRNTHILNGERTKKAPFVGRQQHVFILRLYLPVHDLFYPNFFYWLDVDVAPPKE